MKKFIVLYNLKENIDWVSLISVLFLTPRPIDIDAGGPIVGLVKDYWFKGVFRLLKYCIRETLIDYHI